MTYIKKVIFAILSMEATFVLRRFKPIIIGITGNVGKTSTKEALFILLKNHHIVVASPKSYNSAIGVSLTILGLESAWRSSVGWMDNICRGAWRIISRAPYPEMLVLEMGVDRPGDLDQLLKLAPPKVAIVTAVGEIPVHVEFFATPAALAKEKTKIIKSLGADGTAILNADDPLILAMAEDTRARVLTYGFASNAQVRASAYKLTMAKEKPTGLTFKIDYDGKTVPIKIAGLFGKHQIYPVLAAATAGLALGLNLIEIAEGLAIYTVPKGRGRVIGGIKSSHIIDDSYNASPIATKAALQMLGEFEYPRKIAVLGDMLELGKFSTDAHRDVAAHAAQVADVLVAVGIRAKVMAEAKAKEFHWFANSQEAAEFLKDFVREGDIILVKGSQGVRMEKIVETLMAEPEHARDLLVRQEKYWKKS